ncbi:hypothetical protein ANTRET_LOCUS9475 [Anthophora retusa]
MATGGQDKETTLMRQILDRINKMEENFTQQFHNVNVQLRVLDTENKARAKEIENLARNLKANILTDDSASSRFIDTDEAEIDGDAAPTIGPPPRPNGRKKQTREAEAPPEHLIKAVDAIRLIETLRGRDDIGVEDIIKSVRYARANCSDKTTLLKLILIEKITDNAKRSIRYTNINTFEELYDTLRKNVATPSTVGNCRARLQTIKQGGTESVQSYNLRFRQQLNELIYAVQNKHNRPSSRKIAIEEEEQEATRTYILNLRREIGTLVIPSKPGTLLEAQTLASEMELWARDANRISERRPIQKPIAPSPRPNLSTMPLSDRMQLKCTKCNKSGHTVDRCYQKNFPFSQQGKLPPRVNMTTEEIEPTIPNEETNLQYESTVQRPIDSSRYDFDQGKAIFQEYSSLTQEQESTY